MGADRILATKLGAYAVEQLLQGAHMMMAGGIRPVRLVCHPLALTGDKKKAGRQLFTALATAGCSVLISSIKKPPGGALQTKTTQELNTILTRSL